MTPALSIVIPTWNGRELLAECLASLARQTFGDFEIVVVDDGSTDGTAGWLRAAYPAVRAIECPKNRGFVVAVNRGLGVARGNWVLLLNNDVTLAEDCLERLMAVARAGEFGMIAPLVLWTDDPRLVYSAGDAMGRSGRPSAIGYGSGRDSLVIETEPFGVSGGYGLFSRALIGEAGILDPSFGAYFEDADLCFRARWAGWRAAVVPEAVAWHRGSATIRDRLWWRTRQCYRNHALLVVKNFSLAMLWWNAGAIIRERAHQFGRVFAAARHEWGAARAAMYTFSAWLGLVARIPGALLRRRAVMSRRKVSSASMQALLVEERRDG